MFKLVLILYSFSIVYAHAYLGPGTGAGLIAATLGVVIGIFAAIFGILWFPLKRFLKNKKNEEKK